MTEPLNNINFDAEINSSGESSIDERIENLTKSLEKANKAFCDTGKNLEQQIGLWLLICVAIICFSYCCFQVFFDKKFEEQFWTWQYVYYTAIRITAISAIFYVASFSFNMLKSAILLFQKNKNKIAIINSMASFVESGVDRNERKLIFNKLIGIVVDSSDEQNEKIETSVMKLTPSELIELIKKLKD